jgi:hypothetical protein
MSVLLCPDGTTIAQDCPVLSTAVTQVPRTMADLELRLITDRRDDYDILRPTILLLNQYWTERVKVDEQTGTGAVVHQADRGADIDLETLSLEIWIRGFRSFLKDETNL